jgi:hypothetical protein
MKFEEFDGFFSGQQGTIHMIIRGGAREIREMNRGRLTIDNFIGGSVDGRMIVSVIPPFC